HYLWQAIVCCPERDLCPCGQRRRRRGGKPGQSALFGRRPCRPECRLDVPRTGRTPEGKSRCSRGPGVAKQGQSKVLGRAGAGTGERVRGSARPAGTEGGRLFGGEVRIWWGYGTFR